VVLDTGFLIGIFVEKDNNHDEAERIKKAIMNKPATQYGVVEVLDYVIDEFLTRIKSDPRLKEDEPLLITEMTKQLIKNQKISLKFTDEKLFHKAYEMFIKDKCKLSFTDEVIIQYFKQRTENLESNAPKYIVSFDGDFDRPDISEYLLRM
jgi:predicted nucleic acid-binding protein